MKSDGRRNYPAAISHFINVSKSHEKFRETTVVPYFTSVQHPYQQRYDEDDDKKRRAKAALHPRKHRRHPSPLRGHHFREGKRLSVNRSRCSKTL